MNILIVEDDAAVAKFVQNIVCKIAVVNMVDTAQSFDEGFEKSVSEIFDVALVDIFLQRNDFTGIDLCKSIRKQNHHMPLIILTSAHNLQCLEAAFEAGANDYIQKPFRPTELKLRVERWFSYAQHISVPKKWQYQELSYDPSKNEFEYQGKKLPLSKKKKALLRILLQNPEKVVSPAYIREKIWGDYDLTKSRNLRSNIQLLRESLEGYCADWVHTIRGEGYVLQKIGSE